MFLPWLEFCKGTYVCGQRWTVHKKFLKIVLENGINSFCLKKLLFNEYTYHYKH